MVDVLHHMAVLRLPLNKSAIGFFCANLYLNTSKFIFLLINQEQNGVKKNHRPTLSYESSAQVI